MIRISLRSNSRETRRSRIERKRLTKELKLALALYSCARLFMTTLRKVAIFKMSSVFLPIICPEDEGERQRRSQSKKDCKELKKQLFPWLQARLLALAIEQSLSSTVRVSCRAFDVKVRIREKGVYLCVERHDLPNCNCAADFVRSGAFPFALEF
jgi:hypothetical protein